MARSKCSNCSENFSSESAFNMHRVGSYGDPIYDAKGRVVVGYAKSARRCLTKAEMCAKNMVENEKGIWTTGFDPNLAGTFAKKVSNGEEEHEEEVMFHQEAAQDMEESEKEQEFSSPRR